MKKVIFTIFALCVLCVGLQAQTPTTNTKGVTATGQRDTVRNTRVQTTPPVQTRFVGPNGELGKRQSLSRTGQRLKAKIVITNQVDIGSLTSTSATVQVAVTDSGDFVLPVIQRGVCYGTTPNPTMTNANTVDSPISGDGPGLGNFEVQISGLQLGITYHLRAYAVIVDDTVYSEDVTFSAAFACGHDKMVDADGNKYETVMLGSQCWTKTNLRTKKFRNGTDIFSGSIVYGKAAFYQPDNDDPLEYNHLPGYNDSIFGLYYNWCAAADTGDSHLCPEGWRVPNDESWDAMLNYVKSQPQYNCGGSNDNIAKALADSLRWSHDSDNDLNPCYPGVSPLNNNVTGFTAVPAGRCFFYSFNDYHQFDEDSIVACFWSSSHVDGGYMRCYQFVINNEMCDDARYQLQDFGLSVRCVRDLPPVSLSCNQEKVSVCELAPATVVYTATTETVPSHYSWSVSGGTGAVLANGGYSVTYTEPGSYTVTYTAVVSDTLVSSTITTAVGSSGPFFTYSQDGLTVTIHNQSAGISFDWGGEGTETDNGYTYAQAGTYTITAQNLAGCTKSVTVTVPIACGISKVMDNDGHEYETVQLDYQCWTKTNMRVAAGTNKTATQAGSETEPCYYVRPNVNDSIYGYYYNLPATVQVCPEGWHVPSEAEWDTMVFYVGTYKVDNVYKYRCFYDNNVDYSEDDGEYYIARALADSKGWKKCEVDTCRVGNNLATNNATGFSAYPAGIWDDYFKLEFEAAQFWSIDRICYFMNNDNPDISYDGVNAGEGHSVRCVRNLRLNLSSTAVNNRVSVCEAVTVNYQASLTEGAPDSCKWSVSYDDYSLSLSSSPEGNDAFSVTYYNPGIYTVNCVAYKSGKPVINSITTVVVPLDYVSAATITPCTVSQVHDSDNGYTSGTPEEAGTGGVEKLKSGTSNQIESVYDQNGNIYSVVQIGSQCWMAENLRAKNFSSSNSSAPALSDETTSKTLSLNSAYYYTTGGSVDKDSIYGYLYNWTAVMGGASGTSNSPSGVQGICPKGWHVPSYDELNQMTASLGMTESTSNGNKQFSDAGKLATGCPWDTIGVAQNETNAMPGNLLYSLRNSSGFGGIPAGSFESGGHNHVHIYVNYWTTSQATNSDQAYSFGVDYNSVKSGLYPNTKSIGMSVRCLRDVTLDISSTAIDDNAYICGDTNVTVTYTAIPSNGTEGYTYSWEDAVGPLEVDGNSFQVKYTTTGTYTYSVTCTANGSGVSMTKSITTTVSTGVQPSFATCEENLTVTLKSVSHVDTIHRGEKEVDYIYENPDVGTNWTYPTVGVYNITAVSSHGCMAVKTVGLDTTLHPCTLAGMAHTDANVYIGTSSIDHGTGGLETETAPGSKIITQVTDQDGNVYPVVQIGSQCWMAENLRTTHYDNSLSNISNLSLTEIVDINAYRNDDTRHSSGYYTAPGTNATTSNPSLVPTYGYLYNWAALMAGSAGSNTTPSGVQGICPKGWHVPSKSEYDILLANDNNHAQMAVKLSGGCSWTETSDGRNANDYSNPLRNSLGFGALPAGCLRTDWDGLALLSFEANFWTSYSSAQKGEFLRIFHAYTPYQYSSDYNNDYCLSVRCLRNPVLDLSTVTTDTTVQHGWTVTGTLGTNVKISIADGATVTLHGVNINGNGTWNTGNYAGITCLGDATLILEDSSTVKGFDGYYPGIYVFGDATPSNDKTLTIMGTGTLNASSNGHAAGIGGGWSIHCGNIVITGGKVIATGGSGAAAIGGGNNSRCGNITIGGTAVVFATSESRGAGIGGGYLGVCGNITISGTAVVSATGGGYGAGIGAGGGYFDSSCGNILIEGGTVEATGGSTAAGIGCGGNSSLSSTCGTITITTGVTRVKATKGVLSPFCIGIGDGNCSCDTITIGGVNKGILGVGDSDNYIYEPTH